MSLPSCFALPAQGCKARIAAIELRCGQQGLRLVVRLGGWQVGRREHLLGGLVLGRLVFSFNLVDGDRLFVPVRPARVNDQVVAFSATGGSVAASRRHRRWFRLLLL